MTCLLLNIIARPRDASSESREKKETKEIFIYQRCLNGKLNFIVRHSNKKLLFANDEPAKSCSVLRIFMHFELSDTLLRELALKWHTKHIFAASEISTH